MKNMPQPRDIPQLAHNLARWTKADAPVEWAYAHMRGTKFVAPPCLPSLSDELGAMELDLATKEAQRVPAPSVVAGMESLAAFYAQTLERAKVFSVSAMMTNLAMRTKMEKFRLTLDMLPKHAPWGFVLWDLPIGEAESHEPVTTHTDVFTGEILDDPVLTEEKFSPYANAHCPIIAASWRYLPEYDTVWVMFHANNDAILEKVIADHPDHAKILRAHFPPISYEREQALPLSRTLNWCHDDPADGPRLELTASVDISKQPERLHEIFEARNASAQRDTSLLVKTLISTWMLMKWKIANRVEIPAPVSVHKEPTGKGGKKTKRTFEERTTTVVDLGAPLQRRATPAGERKKGQWTVQAIIGPVIRTRQYIPAWDTYDEEPRLIEPFFAGPPGAPISNADKVFLLK